jgi:hypothetical protein
MAILRNNLFEEAMAATAPAPSPVPTDPNTSLPANAPVSPAPAPDAGGFQSPYMVSNQEALTKELDDIKKNTAGLSDKIIETYKKNEFSLKIGMAAEPNFDRFSVLLKNTFSLNQILVDVPEVQAKLAALISLAYFHAQKDPDKRFLVYSNRDTANMVTEAIFKTLVGVLKMTFLTYDTEFATTLKKAIFSVVFYEKPKKKV